MSFTKDEKVFTESGGMCWMDDGFEMYANTRGGLLKGLGRAMAGESIFLTTYTAGNDNSEIAFGSSFPGKILPITLCDGDMHHSENSLSSCGRQCHLATILP